MRQKRTFIRAAAVGLAVVLACEALLFTGGFEFLENRSFFLRVRLLPPPEPPPADIVIVDIDNPSFAALSEAVGRWPWTRLLWADLAKFIQQGQPRAIVFDAVFSGREDEEVDREFAQALAQSGNVILAYAFVAYEAERAGGAAGAPRAVPGAVALATAAATRGALGGRPALLTENELRWGKITVPLTEHGLLVPRWRTDRAAFARLPLWQVVCSYAPENCEEGKRFFAPDVFRDKIVIVGASATGAFDVFATPIGELTPGFLVHAAALESLLTGRAYAPPPAFWTHLLVVLLAGLGLAASWSLRSAARSALVVATLIVVYLAAAAVAFQRSDLWLPVAAPGSALLVSF